MPDYMYTPKVELLLIHQTEEKVEVVYNANANPIKMPIIGPRPPYYANPRYEAYFPII